MNSGLVLEKKSKDKKRCWWQTRHSSRHSRQIWLKIPKLWDCLRGENPSCSIFRIPADISTLTTGANLVAAYGSRPGAPLGIFYVGFWRKKKGKKKKVFIPLFHRCSSIHGPYHMWPAFSHDIWCLHNLVCRGEEEGGGGDPHIMAKHHKYCVD